MGRFRGLALLGTLLLGGSGCGTVLNFHAGMQNGERCMIYGGVRLDAVVIANMFSGEDVHGVGVFWLGLLYLVDLPLSLVADTITLPVTLFIEVLGSPGKREVTKPPP